MSRWTASLLMLTVVWPHVGQTTLNPPEEEEVRAEEHGNVTLTCALPADTDMALHALIIDISKENPLEQIYRNDSRHDCEPFVADHYRGRLHFDPESSKNGSIQFVLTNVRLNDAGKYRCVVRGRTKSTNVFHLVVGESKSQTEPNSSQPASRGRIGLIESAKMIQINLETPGQPEQGIHRYMKLEEAGVSLFPSSCKPSCPSSVQSEPFPNPEPLAELNKGY